jgi:hypothetical protein
MSWYLTSAATPTWVNDSGGQLAAATSTPWAVTYTPQGGSAITLNPAAGFGSAAGSLAAAKKIMAASREDVIDPSVL